MGRLEERGAPIGQWYSIKSASLDAVIAGGGMVTHYQAVGRNRGPRGPVTLLA